MDAYKLLPNSIYLFSNLNAKRERDKHKPEKISTPFAKIINELTLCSIMTTARVNEFRGLGTSLLFTPQKERRSAPAVCNTVSVSQQCKHRLL